MRRLALLAPLVMLAACGTKVGPKPAPAERAPVFQVPATKSLAGREVAESAQAGWTVRTTRSEAQRASEADEGKPGHRERLEAHLGAAPPTGGAAGATSGPAEEEAKTGGDAPKADAGAGVPGAPPPPTPAASPRPMGPGGVLPPALRKPGDEVPSPTTVPPAPPPTAPALKAGSTDDNADFAAFLTFLASWSDRADAAEKIDPLDVSDRRFVAVSDSAGRPFPGAHVRVLDEARDTVVWEATTYGDGRAPFYPRAAVGTVPGAKAAPAPKGGWLLDVRAAGTSKQVRWDGQGDTFTVRMDVARNPDEPVRLDVGFLVDTTGSMGDEIERIKSTLLEVTRRLKDLGREFDLRYGAVLYKDLDDAYVTMAHPFTSDVDAFAKALAVMEAGGGGDTPESLNQGLAEAVGRLAWRDGAAKVLFLVADASPHMDYQGDVPYGTSVRAAIAKGIRIHSVAASGLEPFGTVVFRQVAQATRGKFVFIEYGSAEASAESHGVKGKVKSNNLDDILFEQVQDEIAAWGRAPQPTPAAAPQVRSSAK
jgi:hypothetical protein